MPSRRRSRSKNLTNNLADVQRRLRFLERRPVRTKLANRVVTRVAIAPNSVSADEADFGTSVVVPPGEDIDDFKSTIENPKEGLLVVDTDTGESQVYSEEQEVYVSVADPVAQVSADAAADAAVIANNAAIGAQFTASTALTTAGNKNRVFYATSETEINTQATSSGYTLKEGDLWFDTANGYRMSRRGATSWGQFQLGDLAVSAISAGKITAGQISLSQGITIVAGLGANANSSLSITNSGIAAVNDSGVETFSINSSGNAFFGGTLTAGVSITSPIITGGTIRTSSSGNRVEFSDLDEVKFFDENNAVAGRLGPFDFGTFNSGVVLTGGDNYFSSPYINLQSANGAASIYMGIAGSYPSINMYSAQTNNPDDTGGMLIATGGATSSDGQFRVSAGAGGIKLESWTGSSSGAPDYIEFRNGGNLDFIADKLNLFGSFVSISDSFQQGTGAPTEAEAVGAGHIIFKYT